MHNQCCKLRFLQLKSKNEDCEAININYSLFTIHFSLLPIFGGVVLTELKRTWAEINLDNLEYNYRKIRERAGKDVRFLGVVKADAYGHGALRVSKTLAELGADYLAVSSLDEAEELRNGGIEMPILILGHTPPSQVEKLLRFNITQTVTCEAKALEYQSEAERIGGRLRIHIKLDTGMSRLGFLCKDAHFDDCIDAVVRSCALPNLDAEGIFTHFAVSDEAGEENREYTLSQFALFKSVLDALEKRGVRFKLRHCANSGAFANYPETYLDMVRPGILTYGCGSDARRLGLLPVMSEKTVIGTIKVFDEDTSISYGRLYTTKSKKSVDVIFNHFLGRFFVNNLDFCGLYAYTKKTFSGIFQNFIREFIFFNAEIFFSGFKSILKCFSGVNVFHL